MESITRYSNQDEYTAKSIFYHANSLVNQYGFTTSDVEDIRQDLWLYLYRHKGQYDPSRGSWRTFVDRFLRSRIRDIIRKHTSLTRDYTRIAASLDEPAHSGNGQSLLFSETLAEPRWLFGITPLTVSGMDQIDLKVDVWRVIQTLQPELQKICMELMRGTQADTARALGLNRQKVYRSIKEIRAVFSAAGLDQYYVGV